MKKEKDILLDDALRLIADVVGPAGKGFWSLSAVRERNVHGRDSVRVGIVMRTPDNRLYDVHGVIGGPEDWAGCENKLVETLRKDGWPLRPSEEETRIRLEVMGSDEAIAILKRYKADLDRIYDYMAKTTPEQPDLSEESYRAEHPHRCCMSWY